MPCDSCDNILNSLTNHDTHFETMHEEVVFSVNCVFPICECETSVPEELRKRLDLVHQRWIEKTLRKKCLTMIKG